MLIDGHNHVGVELLTYLRGEFPYAQQLPDLVSEGAIYGISRYIVFPMVTYLGFDLKRLRQGEIVWSGDLEPAPYVEENRRLMAEVYDLFPEEGKAAIPFVMVDPLRETAAQSSALRELRRRYRFYGLKIQSTILQSPIKSLLNEGRVFLDLAREWDLPFLIHSSVLPADRWAQASDILDIVEQEPELRFCLAHSCRFDRTQLDRLAGLSNAWVDCSAHGIHCKLAAADHPAVAPRDRRFRSDYREPAQVLRDLAEAYPQKLIWGSDSPYYSFVAQSSEDRLDLRSSYEREATCLQFLPDEWRQAVAHDNPIAFLGWRHG